MRVVAAVWAAVLLLWAAPQAWGQAMEPGRELPQLRAARSQTFKRADGTPAPTGETHHTRNAATTPASNSRTATRAKR
jgi:hypothetical protein